jgi:ATP-binding cassette subfamily F protein uup
LEQRPAAGRAPNAAKRREKPAQEKPAAEKPEAEKPAAKGLSFTEAHRLEALPDEIARLEAEIGKLNELLADPELYTREPVKFAKATEMLGQRGEALAAAEEEWLALAEKAEG